MQISISINTSPTELSQCLIHSGLSTYCKTAGRERFYVGMGVYAAFFSHGHSNTVSLHNVNKICLYTTAFQRFKLKENIILSN